MRNCSSSVAAGSLAADFPLFSTLMAFNCDCISCCTFTRQRLNPIAWLQITEDSLAVFSHLRNISCEMERDWGGLEAIPACLAIRR